MSTMWAHLNFTEMSEEIDESSESDQSKLFSQLNNRDCTFSVRFSVEDVLAFARGIDGKYAEQKESINSIATWVYRQMTWTCLR